MSIKIPELNNYRKHLKSILLDELILLVNIAYNHCKGGASSRKIKALMKLHRIIKETGRKFNSDDDVKIIGFATKCFALLIVISVAHRNTSGSLSFNRNKDTNSIIAIVESINTNNMFNSVSKNILNNKVGHINRSILEYFAFNKIYYQYISKDLMDKANGKYEYNRNVLFRNLTNKNDFYNYIDSQLNDESIFKMFGDDYSDIYNITLGDVYSHEGNIIKIGLPITIIHKHFILKSKEILRNKGISEKQINIILNRYETIEDVHYKSLAYSELNDIKELNKLVDAGLYVLENKELNINNPDFSLIKKMQKKFIGIDFKGDLVFNSLICGKTEIASCINDNILEKYKELANPIDDYIRVGNIVKFYVEKVNYIHIDSNVLSKYMWH